MPANAESSSRVAGQLRLRRPRRSKDPILEKTDLNPQQIPSIIQSTRCKSPVSALLLSTCSGDNSNGNSSGGNPKKKNFASGSLRGLGCAAASAQVSVPAAIRTSADWEAKKVRKKKQRSGVQLQKKVNPNQSQNQAMGRGESSSSSVMVVPDIWCGPGIGFAASDAAAAASVDCVVSRRPAVPVPVSGGRGKVDGEKMNQRDRERERETERERERPSCYGGRALNPEHMSLLDLESTFGRTQPESDVFGARYYRHVRHHSPEGLAEIMLFRSSLLMGRRPYEYDRYREWRLDVDNMSYEELLELGDRIGYVSTGLREDEIKCCLRQTTLSLLNDLSLHLPTEMEPKCSICQEEYEGDDEMGKLECGHFYHMECIKQWLAQKNTCPVCKSEAAAAAAAEKGGQ